MIVLLAVLRDLMPLGMSVTLGNSLANCTQSKLGPDLFPLLRASHGLR